jgi:para-nitrobenzyl esterase
LRWRADAQDTQRSQEISAYWIAFARRSDPNGDRRPQWPRYTAEQDVILDFANDGPRVRSTPAARPLDAIAATYLPSRRK